MRNARRGRDLEGGERRERQRLPGRQRDRGYTAAFAASTDPRRGTAANVALIDPLPNSLLSSQHAEDADGELPERQPAEQSSVGS